MLQARVSAILTRRSGSALCSTPWITTKPNRGDKARERHVSLAYYADASRWQIQSTELGGKGILAKILMIEATRCDGFSAVPGKNRGH